MSALNLNKVLLCGRLTADVELKMTTNGRHVVAFTLAINRPRSKDGAQQTADFLSCVAWDKTAEFISQYFGKGDSVFICGKLQTRNYKDRDGKTIYKTEVIIDEAQFVDNKTQQTPAPDPMAEYEELEGGEADLPF